MKLWSGFPDRLVDTLPIWKIVFMIIFGIDVALSSIVPDAVQMKVGASVLIVFVAMIASIFIFSKDFMRRISSGRRWLQISSALCTDDGDVPKWKLKLYRGYLPVTRYIVAFIVFLAISEAYAELIETLLPSFSSDQDLGIPDGNVWISLGIAFLGCLEEYWRWSMIIALLWLVKWIFRKQWASKRSVRNIGFWFAVLVSSLVFGFAHYQEFSTYKAWSYIVLGIAGLILALAAIVTRRFLVAVALHFVYDFLAGMSSWFEYIHVYLYGLAALLILVVLLTFVPLLRSVWPALQVAETSDVHSNRH